MGALIELEEEGEKKGGGGSRFNRNTRTKMFVPGSALVFPEYPPLMCTVVKLDYFNWPLRKQADYKHATRRPTLLSPFPGTRQ